jgi:hypothetical protein
MWSARKGMLAGALLWSFIWLVSVWKGGWDGRVLGPIAMTLIFALLGGVIAYQNGGRRW